MCADATASPNTHADSIKIKEPPRGSISGKSLNGSMGTHNLSLREVTVSFGGLLAINNVSFELRSGHIMGLIGPNGAGKSTIVNVVTGLQRPTHGAVFLDGADITDVKPFERRHLGVSRTFQAGRLFNNMTVLENVEAIYAASGESIRKASEHARGILDWVGIAHLAGTIAATLPYTDQRRVGIARAVALQPKFVLLDEIAAGMSDHECEEIMEITLGIPRELGCGVLFIEHNMHVVMNVCDTIHVLDGGRSIAEGTPAEIQNSEAVKQAYLG